MTAWLQIEFGHIFGYFIKRPGVLHKRNCWIGRVCKLTISFRVVLFVLFPLGLLTHIYIDYLPAVLLAKVNPSMKSPDEPHALWIAVEPYGVIITAHCSLHLIAHCSSLAATALAWQLLSTSYSIPHHSEGT